MKTDEFYLNFLFQIYWMRCWWSFPLKGQTPNSISQRMVPALQMSAFQLQAQSFRTSGAILNGDPAKVFSIYPFEYFRANPKSTILICPSLSMMFAGFKSLWMMFIFFMAYIPFKIYPKNFIASFSGILFLFLIYSARLPPSQYYRKIQKLVCDFLISMQLTMQSFLRFLSTVISLQKVLISSSEQEDDLHLILSLGMTLTASQQWFGAQARYTFAKLPSPRTC